MSEKALSLALAIPYHSIADRWGWESPWEVATYESDVANLLRGAVFDFSSWSATDLQGRDAADFLNRLSTLNFKNFDHTATRLGAFLTGKSGVVALGFFQSEETGFRIWVSPPQKTALEEHLEKMHFAEDLQRKDRSGDYALFAVYGTSPRQVLRAWPDPAIEALHWCVVARDKAVDWLRSTLASGVSLCGERAFEYLRLGAGLPRVGVEVSEQTLLLEAGLENAVDRGKGCYPGQEVIERIFTYGQVNRKLVRVKWSGSLNRAALPMAFMRDTVAAAVLVSAEQTPGEPERGVGLAFVRKQFWNSGTEFEQAGLHLVVS